jgi:WLM domain.
MSGRKPEKLSSTLRNATSKPSWGARIHTLNTVDAANYGEVISANREGGSSSTKSLSPSSSFVIHNITTLPSDENAMALLRRVQSEFTIIAQKRGYAISSVTEMCCCADGLDHLPGKKRGRKTRTMPNNVLGYNLTQGTRGGGQRRSVHRIHLRLRHPNRHTFYSYDDIAGVMCHELAHCEVGPHNAQFYKVMDEIMEQHAVFMVRGVVTDQSGFPINSDDAHVLGGGRTGDCVGNDRRRRHEEIAQNRLRKQKMLGLGGSFRLGGGFLPGGTAAASLAHLPPSEAAKVAAERRIEELRRNDSKYCLPCQEVIEILDASSDEEEEMKGEKDLGRIGTDCPNNVQQAQKSEVIITR